MHALDGVFGSFSTVGDKPVHDPSIFPRTKRPMREPLAGLNDLLLNLLRYTPAVQNARENQKQWSEHLERAEPETSELPVEAGWVPRPHFQCRA